MALVGIFALDSLQLAEWAFCSDNTGSSHWLYPLSLRRLWGLLIYEELYVPVFNIAGSKAMINEALAAISTHTARPKEDSRQPAWLYLKTWSRAVVPAALAHFTATHLRAEPK